MKKSAIIVCLLVTITAFANWLKLDSNNNYPNARISALCCSSDGRIVYQAIANDNGGPAILLKSTDKGQTWLKYTGGVPEQGKDGNWSGIYNIDEPEQAEISSLACSADGKILYVGLHRRGKSYPSLFRTINGGDNWMSYVAR
jgi:hypothetical protein